MGRVDLRPTASSSPEEGAAEEVALTNGSRSAKWAGGAKLGAARSVAMSSLPGEEAKGVERAEDNGTTGAMNIADAGARCTSPAGWPAGGEVECLTTANKSSSSEFSGVTGRPGVVGGGTDVSPPVAIPTKALS